MRTYEVSAPFRLHFLSVESKQTGTGTEGVHPDIETDRHRYRQAYRQAYTHTHTPTQTCMHTHTRLCKSPVDVDKLGWIFYLIFLDR